MKKIHKLQTKKFFISTGTKRQRKKLARLFLKHASLFQGDFTETVEVDFDPEVTSYDNLLKMFWNNHNPSVKV
jgi:peptide methionine sulfoxide reductase MsrA